MPIVEQDKQIEWERKFSQWLDNTESKIKDRLTTSEGFKISVEKIAEELRAKKTDFGYLRTGFSPVIYDAGLAKLEQVAEKRLNVFENKLEEANGRKKLHDQIEAEIRYCRELSTNLDKIRREFHSQLEQNQADVLMSLESDMHILDYYQQRPTYCLRVLAFYVSATYSNAIKEIVLEKLRDFEKVITQKNKNKQTSTYSRLNQDKLIDKGDIEKRLHDLIARCEDLTFPEETTLPTSSSNNEQPSWTLATTINDLFQTVSKNRFPILLIVFLLMAGFLIPVVNAERASETDKENDNDSDQLARLSSTELFPHSDKLSSEFSVAAGLSEEQRGSQSYADEVPAIYLNLNSAFEVLTEKKDFKQAEQLFEEVLKTPEFLRNADLIETLYEGIKEANTLMLSLKEAELAEYYKDVLKSYAFSITDRVNNGRNLIKNRNKEFNQLIDFAKKHKAPLLIKRLFTTYINLSEQKFAETAAAQYHYRCGLILIEMNEDDMATEEFNMSQAAAPQSQVVYFAKGLHQWMLSNEEVGLTFLKTALKPALKGDKNLFRVLWRLIDPDNMKLIRSKLANLPDIMTNTPISTPNVLKGRAVLAFLRGKYQHAEELARKVDKLQDPDSSNHDQWFAIREEIKNKFVDNVNILEFSNDVEFDYSVLTSEDLKAGMQYFKQALEKPEFRNVAEVKTFSEDFKAANRLMPLLKKVGLDEQYKNAFRSYLSFNAGKVEEARGEVEGYYDEVSKLIKFAQKQSEPELLQQLITVEINLLIVEEAKSESYYLYGLDFVKMGADEMAAEAFDKSIAAAPKNSKMVSTSYFAKGLHQWLRSNKEVDFSLFETAFAKDPNLASVFWALIDTDEMKLKMQRSDFANLTWIVIGMKREYAPHNNLKGQALLASLQQQYHQGADAGEAIKQERLTLSM